MAGVCPTVMGRGPTPAIQQLLAKTGLTLDDIDLVDVSFYKMFSSFITF